MGRGEGIGLVAGVAALALGGIAAGFKLERELVGRRLRPQLAEAGSEPFFSLRSSGPTVETLDGVRLHVEVDELRSEPNSPTRTAEPVEGQRPTLVFVHGYALSLDCWHFQRKHFRDRYRMIFYDQRSHGRSDRSAAKLCRIPQLATDLAQILQEVAGSGPVILIGHSMGGMTIMELARQHPEWFGRYRPGSTDRTVDGVGPIIGVGLVCTSADDLLDRHPVRGFPGRVASRLAEPAMAVLNRIPTAVEQTRKAGSDLAYLITREMSYPSPVPPSYVKFLGEMLSVTPLDVIADFYPAFADLDEVDGLKVINTVPTTVIGGKQDLVLPFRHTEAILDELPDAARLVLDPCGHMAMIEHHQRVDRALDELIDRAI
ncbi:alpha/beta fold hydrolase [Microlunatus soli]|uniref:alpha/beta fold hydrolase n=1 Tax=Microlunatus soli TaxID=630515 RepID=UPI0012FC8565|nr:alpha/beta hydrolase [Microlunatus soli]